MKKFCSITPDIFDNKVCRVKVVVKTISPIALFRQRQCRSRRAMTLQKSALYLLDWKGLLSVVFSFQLLHCLFLDHLINCFQFYMVFENHRKSLIQHCDINIKCYILGDFQTTSLLLSLLLKIESDDKMCSGMFEKKVREAMIKWYICSVQ